MSKLEELEQQIEQNELNIGTIILKIADIKKQIDSMKAEKEKPEYPDGTPGWFWDDNQKIKSLAYLVNSEVIHNMPYGRLRDKDSYPLYYKNFEPLTETILGMAVEYNGVEYLGSHRDELRVEYKDGTIRTRNAEDFSWSNNNCQNPKVRYWIIKRAEK